MKQIIPILASVAVVGVIAVAFLAQGPGTNSNNAANTESVSAPEGGSRASLNSSGESSSTPGVDSPVPNIPPPLPTIDSFSAKLAGQSMFVLDIFPRQLDELVTPVFTWVGKIRETNAWKKHQPDQILAAGAEAAAGNPMLSTLTSGGFGEMPPEVKEVWNSLDEVSLSLASKMIPIEAQGKTMKIPAIALLAKFASDTQAKKYSDMIQAQIEPLKMQAEGMGAEITQPNPNTIDISANVPGSSEPVVASLTMKGSHFILLLGTKDPLEFFAKKSSTPSPASQLISRSWLNKTAIGAVMQIDQLMKLVKDLMAASLPPDQNSTAEIEQLEKLLAYFDGIGLSALALGVEGQTLRQNGCVQIDPKKRAGELYANVLARQKPSVTARLIDERTILAFDYPLSALQQSWGMFESADISTLASSPDEKKNFELLNKVYPILSKFEFSNLVALVEAAPSGSMPRFGVLLSDSKMSGEALLQQFTDSVNELTAIAQSSLGGAEPTGPIASLTKTGTTSQIKFATSSLPFVGQLAGPNSIVFGIDPYFLSGVSAKLESAKGSDYLLSKLPQAKDDLASSSQTFIFNVGLGLDLARPYANMAIPAGAGVSMEEVDEVANLFRSTLVSTQRMQKVSDDVICTHASGYTF